MKSLAKMEVVVVVALYYELTKKESGHFAILMTKVLLDQVQDRTNSILKNTLQWQNKI